MTGITHFVTLIQRARRGAPAVALLLVAAASGSLAHAGSGQAARDPRPALDPSSCSRPVYPEQDAREKNAGTVVLYFLIGPEGDVLESKIQRSSGHPSLDEAARSALAKCRFRPPMVDGKPVRAWTGVQYVWTPE